MPFCSEECRREQIEIDEAKERSSKLFIKASSSRKDQQRKNADAGGAKSEKIHVRAGTVVAGFDAISVRILAKKYEVRFAVDKSRFRQGIQLPGSGIPEASSLYWSTQL
ncbi:hypothetical protein BHM03_00059456 [Ensete ventricosum]|nr:hypothetical protein BHM03_00059456 [Ensete ventricosum]